MVLKEKSESGRTMAEMLAVLAIIGVLSITALVGFRYAMELHKENESVDWIVKTVAGSRTGFLLEKYGDEAGLLNPKAVPMQEVISGVAFDFASADDKSSRTYTTPLATKVSVDVISKNAFEVHLENVTFSMCRKLLNGPLEYRFASSNQSETEILPTSSTEEIDEFCGGIDAARRSPSKPQPEVVTDAVVTLCFSLDREGCFSVPACGQCQIERNGTCQTCSSVGLTCCDDGACRSVCEATCNPPCDATKCETCVNGVCESKCRDGSVCCPDGTCAATLAECNPNSGCAPDACHVCDGNNPVNRCPQPGDDTDKTKCCTDTIIGVGTVFDKCVRPDESCDDHLSVKNGCGDAGDGCPVTCDSDEICVGSTPGACGGVCRPERSGCGSSGLCEESPCAPGFECVGNVENGCGGTCQPILSGCGDLYECPEQCAPGQRCVGAVENACGGTCSWDPVPPESESTDPETTSSSESTTPEETSLSEVSESESESTSPTETDSSSESDTPETSVSGETSGESSDVPESSGMGNGGNDDDDSDEEDCCDSLNCESGEKCETRSDGTCGCVPDPDVPSNPSCSLADIACPAGYSPRRGQGLKCIENGKEPGDITADKRDGVCCPAPDEACQAQGTMMQCCHLTTCIPGFGCVDCTAGGAQTRPDCCRTFAGGAMVGSICCIGDQSWGGGAAGNIGFSAVCCVNNGGVVTGDKCCHNKNESAECCAAFTNGEGKWAGGGAGEAGQCCTREDESPLCCQAMSNGEKEWRLGWSE